MVVQTIASIDTNIFVSVINREKDSTNSKKVLDWIDEGKIKGIVSTIVLAEICAGYDASGDSKEKDKFLAHILGSPNYEIADVNVTIALDAGSLRSKKSFKWPDALIVSCGLHHNVEFLVTNDEPLRKVPFEGLKILLAGEFIRVFEHERKA